MNTVRKTKTPTADKAKKPPKSIELEFTREKETKGTQRFAEEGEKTSQVVGVLYVKKDGDKRLGAPERVRVTITALPA